MKSNITIILITVILFGCSKKIENQLPNIVFILADDFGTEVLGCYGGSTYSTPNIDALAETGLKFNQCYSAPLCSPSRVKLLTGRYGFRTGQKWGYIPPNEITFGHLLKGQFLNKIANTDTGIRNGNPPSMVKLKSGALCIIYGYRGLPYGIHAKISSDDGKTWSKEIVLREDAISWDLGYLRSIVREDGKVVSVYYYATKERPERHIAATIWDPMGIITNSKK